jgi:thiol:disulfide interchange protein DsbD
MLIPSLDTIALDQPLVALPLVFLGGVLTSLTPCIYPMIPITAAIVGGQTIGGERRPKRMVAALSLSYAIGLAAVYATLGLIAGLTGTLFGSISSNPWAYFTMANLLMIAALAMFDVIPVRLPASWTQRAATAGSGGRVAGTFAMGAASGLVAAPCSAPVMIGVLAWVSATQSAALGFLYLFVFSIGMTTLLIIIGLSAGAVTSLPRSGVWMKWVKRAFGVVMLGMAEYYFIKMGQVWF